ncbi:hypothetical protein IMCC3088_808 [Aequoribacter fuscus]|uniref:Uncharacterized protein n=1 Tax=Aequoribacter fuscus TaxID=2518989 RepID=F3L675_9GAMM|nr:hypothetical protein [Aequoribacter fuscus]EGG28170.1 hypothetical protein IMCC3088_808 [Aequoribacter fuscus]
MADDKQTTQVSVEDLWEALEALDALPETRPTDWYQHLEPCANGATQVILLENGAEVSH